MPEDGAFKVNADGYLVTADGDHVLNATGAMAVKQIKE